MLCLLGIAFQLSMFQNKRKCNVEKIFLNLFFYSTENINFKNVTSQTSAIQTAKGG
jgi:hypothetical protein